MSEESGLSKYVVQQRRTLGNGEQDVVWEDVDTVRVPPRTKRKTIIEKALNGITPPKAGWILRVLDDESAREIPVVPEEQPPRLKIG